MNLLEIIFISILPWIELRGAIPLGIASGYNPIFMFFLCTTTDILIVPLIYVSLQKIVPFFLRIKLIEKLYLWINKRNLESYERYRRLKELGLVLFVGIPLPGTGVYSGTLIAYLLNFKKLEAFLFISIGATIAGILVTLISVGILGFGI